MAHGHEDFHRRTEVFITADDIDLNELAVRLGSIVNFDRRGTVLFANGFEGSMAAFLTSHYISGSSSGINTGQAKDGSASCRLTTAASVLAWVRVARIQPVMSLTRMGFELSFTTWNGPVLHVWEINWYTGSQLIRARITYAKATDELKMLLSDGSERTIATLPLYGDFSNCFHVLKLVADFETREYVRLILNDTTYDLSAYGIHVSAPVTDPHIVSFYEIWGELAGVRYSDIDNYIITKNEPEEV
uniref:Uncharacterized protein n=1 Tax=viral metagenome TaxID=1070528 RepID=A0A6M3M211_9ZZZZ